MDFRATPLSPSKSNSGSEVNEVASLTQRLLLSDMTSSEEDISKKVKEAINMAICQKALYLKNKILNKMKLSASEEELKKIVEQMTINCTVLCSFRNTLSTRSGSMPPQEKEKIKKSMDTSFKTVKEHLARVREIEDEVEALKSCWEEYRQSFKQDIFRIIDYLAKRPNELGQTGGRPSIKWKDFLPEELEINLVEDI